MSVKVNIAMLPCASFAVLIDVIYAAAIECEHVYELNCSIMLVGVMLLYHFSS